MLSYAFKALQENGYKNIETEEFENIGDLFASIIAKSISAQFKRGIAREYVLYEDPISIVRGQIDISKSLVPRIRAKKQIYCKYDVFSMNSYMNRILKTTMIILVKADISKERKKELRRLLRLFEGVDTIDPKFINWHLRYNRNNQTYQMLIGFCYLVIHNLLQSQSEGHVKLMDFLDEQSMDRLYERFILEYYKKEWPQIKTNSSQIRWAEDNSMDDMLPKMQSDIMLNHDNKILIIDAKYYTKNLVERYEGVQKIHSGNLYQIFTYVKNKAADPDDSEKTVSGMLLYAKTDAITQPDQIYTMTGNTIMIKTLDLDCDFKDIRLQLDRIASEYFEMSQH